LHIPIVAVKATTDDDSRVFHDGLQIALSVHVFIPVGKF